MEDKHEKTFLALKPTPRKVLRTLGETVTTLKEMYTASDGNPYAAKIHSDVKAMIPRFKDHYNRVERWCIQHTSGTEKDASDEVVYALAKKVDVQFDGFNETVNWYDKMIKPTQKPKKLKVN